MNRIHNPARSTEEGDSRPSFEAEFSSFALPSHDTSHSLFAPLHYEPKYSYPLIVWMHGPGTAGERQLPEIMPTISLRNYVAVAPRGFRCERSGGPGVVLARLDWPQTAAYIEETERRVFHAIEIASKRCNIAKERVFVAGFGTGGTMAFRMAMNHPHRFAGVLSLSGGFPRGYNPLAHLPAARRLPVFLTVGRDSLDYSPADACTDLRLFHSAGMSVALRQYPCGHELSDQMLRDVDRWIIEQITSSNVPATEADDARQRWSE